MGEHHRHKERRKEWARQNRQKPEVRAKHLADSKRFYRTPEGQAYHRNYRLRKYGLTQADYEAMLAAQDYECAICGAEDWAQRKGLVVDHDHDTGLVRALLCDECNISLGKMGESPNRLRAAAAYLEKFRG